MDLSGRLYEECAAPSVTPASLSNSSVDDLIREHCYAIEIGDQVRTQETLSIAKREILLWGVVLCGKGNAMLDLEAG